VLKFIQLGNIDRRELTRNPRTMSMLDSIISSFRGPKERKEDPGKMRSDPSVSSAKKPRDWIPTRDKSSRSSSRAIRDSHLRGDGPGRTGTSTEASGERHLESSSITGAQHSSPGGRHWSHDENNGTHGTHDGHTRLIASGQYSTHNVAHQGGNSQSPYQVSPLDPGRTYTITEEDKGGQTHRFTALDSALQVPMSAGVKPASALTPAQQAVELSAETARRTQLRELPVAPDSGSANNQTHLRELHSSADMNDTVRQSALANPEPTQPVHSDNKTINAIHTNLTSSAHYTNSASLIVDVEPPRQGLEQSHDFRQYLESNNEDPMHRSQLRTSSSTEEESKDKWLPHELSGGFNNAPVASHPGQNNEMPQGTRTVPDQSIPSPEEGPSRTQGQQYLAGYSSYPLIEDEGMRVPDNTHVSRQGNENPTKRTRPPAQGSMNTNSEALQLNARIQEALRNYNVSKRPGLDPLSALLTWFSETLKENAQIIESQKINLTALSQEPDPKKKDIKTLKKENGTLKKERQLLESYKQKYDNLKKEKSITQGKIDELARELAQAKEKIENLIKERNGHWHKLKETESTLASVRKELDTAQAGLQKYKKQRDDYIQENAQLRRTVEHLQQETKQAQEELLKAAAQYQTEMAQLEENHSSKVSELEQKRALELSDLEHKMQAIIDEKGLLVEARDRQIAAQDLRMASYSKPAHGLISDGDFGARLRDMAMKLDNLADSVPRLQEGYAVDETLDPSNFLSRNAARGSRIWHKFVRNVCWSVILRGFFQRQPGFGAFGDRADGHATLLHLYRLFAPSDMQGKQSHRPSIAECKR